MGLQHSQIPFAQNHTIEHFYLCNYRPQYRGADKISRSLLRFKESLAHDLHAWIDCAVNELRNIVIPSDVIVIRALGLLLRLSQAKEFLQTTGRSAKPERITVRKK